jgi:L-ascorbate metabolism protein UlaG (beta-lactamase superfamily)
MKIKWLGHASFQITSQDGLTIITDPYAPDERLKYDPINESADIVTVSHGHGDHANVSAVKGSPEVVEGAGTHQVKGIAINGVPTYHDDEEGSQRGTNVIFRLNVDGVNVCHLGDLGHPISRAQADEIGEVDVLLIPVGGFFTIDAAVATQVADLIKPRAIIPMHFRNPKCDFPITDVEPFLAGKQNVSRPDSSEVEFQAGSLPTDTETIVLKPSK